ncbi:MAG TPA: flagellar FlbD family protein [Solirubrobacteraceae bacterium]|jgi:flagellar protein FlbD
MIQLHRLGAGPAPFTLNPDLIVTVEANPDTTIALTTGTRVVVTESVEAVVAAVREWRAGILAGAFHRTNTSNGAPAR